MCAATSLTRLMPVSKDIAKIIPLDIASSEVLAPGEIHLYVVPLIELQCDAALFSSYINAEEEARAQRFVNPQHGSQHRCARGMLRSLLSVYLDTAPKAIEFNYAKHGKPSLKNNSQLYFNLSHSRDMAVYAFSLDYELGVDIEFMRAQKDLPGMLRHVGSAQEQAGLKGLSEDDSLEAFYRLWTRKEAFIKAVGRGLGMGLREINIGINAGDSPLAVEYKDEILPGWWVEDIKPPQDYKLAICAGLDNGSTTVTC